MALDFNSFRVVDIKNPSKECVQLCFSDGKTNDLKSTCLIIFEQQVKYIITEEYETHKKVKVYIIDDDDPIIVDFYPEEYHLYETFFMALHNKTI